MRRSVKIGNPANYYVQVYRDAWDEEPETAPLFDGIFSVVLNVLVDVRFVPDAPPWPLERQPPDTEPTSVAEARWYALRTANLAVTPDEIRAGQVAQHSAGTVFYVGPEDFAVFTEELSALSKESGGSNPRLRRDELLDRAVIRFVDDRVVGSPYLGASGARTLGRI